MGFLTLRNADSYWLAVPNVGPFLVHLANGRAELQQALKRRKYQEILEKVAHFVDLCCSCEHG